MADLLYRTSLAVIPRLYVVLTALLFGSCRLKVLGRENLEKVMSQGGVVVPIWHYSVFYMLYHLRQYPGVVMVSASKDGEYIAHVARLLGFETVRGSAHRFGVRALKGLIAHVVQGKNAGIVADGSQGPPRVAQPGVVLLAARAGVPMLPMVWAVKRYRAFHSWDRTVIPLPFSSMVVQYGKPINVPANLTSDQVEEYRVQLEEQMNTMYRAVWRQFGKDGHAQEEKRDR